MIGFLIWLVMTAGQGQVQGTQQCDHSQLASCASQANEDYGPGRFGLVGEMQGHGYLSLGGDLNSTVSQTIGITSPQDNDSYNFVIPSVRPKDGIHRCKMEAGVVTWLDDDPEPIDVPAVRKTRNSKRFVQDGINGYWCPTETVCSTCFRVCYVESPKESYWDCADQHRVLLESMDHSVAVCHKIAEEK